MRPSLLFLAMIVAFLLVLATLLSARPAAGMFLDPGPYVPRSACVFTFDKRGHVKWLTPSCARPVFRHLAGSWGTRRA